MDNIEGATQEEGRIIARGVNFQYVLQFEEVDHTNILCNDPDIFNGVFGIEAARQLMIQEINKVFKHYGIKIDFRNIYLVVDFMSCEGYFTKLNRHELQFSPSCFQKMSFETTCSFLVQSVIR